MRKRMVGEGDNLPNELRCRRSDGRGWRCPARSMPTGTFCEKHYQQRLRYQGPKQRQATLNGGKKRQLKRPRVEETASPRRNKRSPPVRIVDEQETQPESVTGKRKISEEKDCSLRKQETPQRTQPESATCKRKISEEKDCSLRKQETQRRQPKSLTGKRKISDEKDCSRRKQESQRTQAESITGKRKFSEGKDCSSRKQETQRTQPESVTGKRKISEEKDCSSRSTTTEKETNLSPACDVEDVASLSTRQTMEKFPGQEIGRYLRKYLASGVMEIALDYDSDYDFRKVAGLELSQ
ncbi:hypothetical protein SUGI_1159460 [Cryptomeria japonica]|nr:hypothetical protein SUGI_1159460 [Cryptomeria japonica]